MDPSGDTLNFHDRGRARVWRGAEPDGAGAIVVSVASVIGQDRIGDQREAGGKIAREGAAGGAIVEAKACVKGTGILDGRGIDRIMEDHGMAGR
ncbi:hypothetical protein BC938DRAFT_481618 [Jimgerdemannia flammicorona]|uniref:Uncharacterized protein n=1 Tax=Jimgerdemannia flammicorona TaxID=994334 RepID=A0A433QWX7_9FUNG|nr:hypothetical protein BC938DRAFT_481618 [Jimgerdemannia flammicorona]